MDLIEENNKYIISNNISIIISKYYFEIFNLKFLIKNNFFKLKIKISECVYARVCVIYV